jgi:uncharacterized protein with ParB-like and HNH nuclease domain
MEAGILPPELTSIEKLFTGDARFSVPQYQRSFAWGSDEIEELWEDLKDATSRKGDYFLGTVVLQRTGVSTYEIIDGQQRLSCITMIFSAIRNVFLAAHDDRQAQILNSFLGAKGFSRESIIQPKLVLNRINNELFNQYIIASSDYDTIEKAIKAKKLPESNKLLLKAYAYFLEKVTSESAKKGTRSDEFIEPLIDCLRAAVKLITITVTSAEDANLFFESLNARGKELAVSDLVKNRLYSEATDEISRAQQLWEQMENDLGKRPIPDYLRHYWIAKKTEAKKSDDKKTDNKNIIVREKQLYREISQDIKNSKVSTLTLLADLQSSAQDYAKISDYDLWPEDPAYDRGLEESLMDLKLFRVVQCNPLLLNAIQKFQSPTAIAKTFRIVANFSFRYFIIGNQSPGNLELQTGTIAHNIRTGAISKPEEVSDAFRAISPDTKFRDDFTYAVIPKSNAKIARYILGKINNHMARQTGSEQIANPDAKEVNLEHILPQSPSKEWLANFSKDSDPTDYIYRVGNLTLLKAKKNSGSGNETFSKKQEAALNGSSLIINSYFKGLTKWGDKEIEERQVALAKMAVEVWRL